MTFVYIFKNICEIIMNKILDHTIATYSKNMVTGIHEGKMPLEQIRACKN